MTVFKDTRVLTKTAIEAALSILKGETITSPETINNGSGDLPFLVSGIVMVDKSNIDTAMK